METYLDLAKRAIESRQQSFPDRLEDVVSGLAVELWSDAAGRLFIVADDQDARRLCASDSTVMRGEVYTTREIRRVIQISDPPVVAEVYKWKREFNGRLHEASRQEKL